MSPGHSSPVGRRLTIWTMQNPSQPGMGVTSKQGTLAASVSQWRHFSGQTSTTPCATAQGVLETRLTASSRVEASMIANPAIGRSERKNGPSLCPRPPRRDCALARAGRRYPSMLLPHVGARRVGGPHRALRGQSGHTLHDLRTRWLRNSTHAFS